MGVSIKLQDEVNAARLEITYTLSSQGSAVVEEESYPGDRSPSFESLLLGG